MELLGDVGHGESYIGPFEEGVRVDVRDVHGLRRTYRRLGKYYGRKNCTPRLRGSSESSFQSI
jgi:hypothetical protein